MKNTTFSFLVKEKASIYFFIIHSSEALLPEDFIFEGMHNFCFFRLEVIKAEVVQQAMGNIKSKLGCRRMSP